MSQYGVDVEGAVLQGFQEGISTALGLIPEAGPFLQVIFGHVWDIAFAKRTAEKNKAAMDSLFESVSKMIKKALAENIADQARAYNGSISQLGQDYRLSVKSFQEDKNQGTQKIVIRFESCKSTLVHMLNLFAQPTYMQHTVLSYGSALSMYVTLLREMMLSGKVCGYSKSEIKDFQNDINERIKTAFTKVMYEAMKKLVQDGGEFNYPNMGGVGMGLFELVGGVMSFQTEWHDGAACLIAKDHPDYYSTDLVDDKAHYQLKFRPKVGARKNYYSMPQTVMNGRAALHVYTDFDKELELARFTMQKSKNVRMRAYYMVDYDDYDSRNVDVILSTRNNPKVLQFNLNKPYKSIVSFPWVKLYYSNTEGGPWTTHDDKFSTNMRLHYDEYSDFHAKEGEIYTIKTKAASSSVTKGYYIIGFEVVPENAPALLESLFEAVEAVTSAVGGAVAGLTNAGKGLLHF